MGALLIFMPGYISLMTYFLIVGGFSLFGLMASISSISHCGSMSAIILYSINGNAYSEKGYIKRAHEVLGLDPSGSKRSDLYPYYDHIKSCAFNWKSKIPDLDFMLLRLAGRQKYLVTIDHQRVIFNRYGEQFKNLGKSQPYTYCGG